MRLGYPATGCCEKATLTPVCRPSVFNLLQQPRDIGTGAEEKNTPLSVPHPAALPNSVFWRATAPGTSILTGMSCLVIRIVVPPLRRGAFPSCLEVNAEGLAAKCLSRLSRPCFPSSNAIQGNLVMQGHYVLHG